LVEGGFLTEEQLAQALAEAHKQNKSLREVLAEKQVVNAETYTTFLSLYSRVPIVDLQQVQIEQAAVNLIPENVARQFKVLPLAVMGDSLRVAMDNPTDVEAINTLAAVTGKRIQPRIPMHGGIEQILNQYYKVTPKISGELGQLLGEAPPEAPAAPRPGAAPAAATAVQTVVGLLPGEEIAQAPIVRALDMVISQAVKDRASDIHVEPGEDALVIRYRIDGILHEAARLPKGAQAAMVSRVKVLAGMDIAERRRPQDGSFSMTVGEKAIDFRVASIETAHGEMMVMRILDKSTSLFSLSELGFQPEPLRIYQSLLQAPYGMVMVSGPTGSGKTTSLYASINQLDAKSQNIMTIENPIEYHFKGINQIQVNPQAGISFAAGLRSILRLDPNVILVGEIRDAETATTAIQAALTGHLVLTSIHANDAASAIVRLVDLGVEPFLVTSAVIGSVAQRLVRRLCSYCRTMVKVPADEAAAYQAEMQEARTDFYTGRGCNMCSRTGFQGRVGVYEVMVMSDSLRSQVNRGATGQDLRAEAIKGGMMTLRRDGMLKARDGLTTPREIMRSVFTIS
ncbi:MAG: type II/IV secretion system protein, partial [Chloroflexi bacterium]|nr:type II/IV secretion system protein [Chloroflexota bacterium]